MEAADKNSLQGSEGIVQKITWPSQKPKDKGERETCYYRTEQKNQISFKIIIIKLFKN